MGGYGSGRWHYSTTRDTVEGYSLLDVRWLYRNAEGLRPGLICTVIWGNGNRIGLTTYEDELRLNYTARAGTPEAFDVNTRVSLDWTQCHYGGRRPWFRCPRCGRRAGKLYLIGGYFRCRVCGNLAYTCQRENPADRAIRRGDRIRIRLGGNPGIANPFPPRPKGMHYTTYYRLWQEHTRAAEDSWILNPLLRRILGDKYPGGVTR
jgi:hypothetical protein